MSGRLQSIVLSLFAAVGCSEVPDTPPVPDPAPATPRTPSLPSAREVTILTADGVSLRGDLRPGARADAPLVVLVHQIGSSRGEWEPLLARLASEPALSTFALDVRGHGRSTTRRDGEVDYRTFATADWEEVADDVPVVLGHLREEEGLQPRRVAVVGSSLGSSAAIMAAAADPSIAAVVALSPGRAYRGVDVIAPATRLGERPLLVVASRDEAPSAATAEELARIAPRGELLLVDGDAHGVRMFETAPESLARVEAFLRALTAP